MFIAAAITVTLGCIVVAAASYRRRVDRHPARLLGGLLKAATGEQRIMQHDAQVSVVGTLQLRSDPIRRFDNDAPVVATTYGAPSDGRISHGTSVNTRADQIVLTIDGDEIELTDSLEVVSGSQEGHMTAADLDEQARRALHLRLGAVHGAAPIVYRSVRAGDRVRVFGVLRAQAAHRGLSYRAIARRWCLYSCALDCYQGRDQPACVIPVVLESAASGGES